MYLEYHELLKKYKEASRSFNETLEKCGEMIRTVMPKAIQYQEVMINGGSHSPDDKIINYVAKRTEYDDIINSSRNTMTILEYQLKKMALQMERSLDIKDRIYYYKWIQHLSPYKFSKIIGYTPRQIYRLIREMNKELYPKK